MSNDNGKTPLRASDSIAGYHYSDDILKNPDIYPYWCICDASRIWGYTSNHIHLLAREDAVKSFRGECTRYVYTSSMNEHVERMNRND